MKKLFSILIIFTLASCQNSEIKKTTKSRAASDRINSSESNSKDSLKELDE